MHDLEHGPLRAAAEQADARRDCDLPPVPDRSPAALPRLRSLLAIGRIAHDGILDAFAVKRRDFPFAHGAPHALPNGLVMFDSYHCSRQNTNTGRLTTAMFEAVLAEAAASLRTG